MSKSKDYGSIIGFKAIAVNHQRNGISGVPFHSVEFSYTDKGENGRFHPKMLAIVPDDANFEGGDVNVYVVDMFDTSECWRGDNFSEAVRDAIKDHKRAEDRRWKAAMAKGRKLGESQP
jgi:hypothetical protein